MTTAAATDRPMAQLEASPDTGPEALSAADWAEFVASEIDKARTAYISQPKFLLGHFRAERQVADDYAGRELLELVQNAADAATEVGGQGRVRIEINAHGLTVANTGAPFRPGGVQSLMAVHASDKPGRNADLIGAKGLGFRALLNWSREPVISSGMLEIAFSSGHARSVVEALARTSPDIAALCDVDDEADTPAPILAFPAVGAEIKSLVDGKARTLLEGARRLREAGYDTVVTAAFDGEEDFGEACLQASEFRANFLLFVPSLTEIEIAIEGRPLARWSRVETGPDTCDLHIVGSTSETQRWICLRDEGKLSVRGRKKVHTYAIAFALRVDAANAPNPLHSYFPTSVPLPFPGLFHATLELDSNRKAFKANSTVNDLVLKALAAFHARSLATLLKAGRIDNALDFLHRHRGFPESLLTFEREVYLAAAGYPLIATMRGGRATAAKTSLGPKGYEQYLPRRLFGGLAKCRGDEDRETLGLLGVQALEASAAVRMLRKADLSLDERATAIVGIARDLPPEFHHPGLLLDHRLRPVTGANTAFPPPAAEEKLPRLPDWAKARFILPELWRLIVRKSPSQAPREIVRKLSGFGVSEYSNESIIASLRSQAAKALKNGRRSTGQVQRELLSTLFGLYSPLFRPPPGVFHILCLDGAWRDTRETHLSDGYGLSGRITGALYAAHPGFLIAAPVDNGLSGDEEELGRFLIWLGVNPWPRAVLGPVPATLRARIMSALPQVVTFRGGGADQEVSRDSLAWNYNLEATSRMIQGLDKILASAPSDAILSWLAQDPRFQPSAPAAFTTTVQGRRDGKSAFRSYNGGLPDLVRALIADTPWLAGKDDGAHAPADCMIDPGGLKALFHRPRAAMEESEALYGLNPGLWRRGLEHARVPFGLEDVSSTRLVALLKSLPDRDVSADVVRRLYLQVLELERFDTARAATAYREFLAKGRVQVVRGKAREWMSPKDALYADRDGFPAAAREHLALIDLPPRRNGGHVLERFGVAPLSRQSFSLVVKAFEEEQSIIAATLRSSLASARPFIAALRQAVSNDTPHLRRLDRLVLIVARSADIEVEIGDRRIAGHLDPWTHVLQGDRLIIRVELPRHTDELFALAHEAIADGLAELFGVQSGAEFGRLLSASTDGLRRTLLQRMLPNQSDAEIDALLGRPEEEEVYEPVKIDAATLAKGPAPTPSPAPAAAPGQTGASATGTTTDATAWVPPTKAPTPSAITSIALTPQGPATSSTTPGSSRPRFRVSQVTGAIGATSVLDPHRAGDAEDWSLLFEESEGRFPLSVAHLQGPDAFGCDCVSFDTEDDLRAFKADPKRTELIARFIETKSGAVRLTDSQVAAAELRRERYFIYRIDFYSGGREFAELTIVADPLQQKAALVMECQLILEKVMPRTFLRLIPEAL